MVEMEDLTLGVPSGLLERLPEGSDDTAALDMQRATQGLESQLTAIIETADDRETAAREVLDAIEHLEDRIATYDGFVPELRAWGQSPIYAMTWRDLYVNLVAQIHEHPIAASLDRERNYRLVDDGIRLGDLHDDED